MTVATEQPPARPPATSAFARRRAEADGLLAEKGEPTTVRIPSKLLAAARARLGLERTTDVVTTALAQGLSTLASGSFQCPGSRPTRVGLMRW